jgi:hypothetical protein
MFLFVRILQLDFLRQVIKEGMKPHSSVGYAFTLQSNYNRLKQPYELAKP